MSKPELQAKIDFWKRQLQYAWESVHNINDPTVLMISQQLDKYMVEWHRSQFINKRKDHEIVMGFATQPIMFCQEE